MQYAEQLTVSLRWWVQGTMLVATLWFTIAVAIPSILAAALISLGFAVLVAGGLLLYGSARITVGNGELRAGRAHIALDLVGTAEPLDAEGTRRVAGVDADARAYLLLRPYLKRSVRIEITDPRDPAPYWLVSTRRPDKLVAALSAVTAE
ncbi:DUF3093 domain-containing protein [Nocardioides jensenii]|uniref:DUF3093 domain-containing protein n=1 Tax=Nocardioides jensenii TaxID=1843 RepID=UPI000831A8EB|nr:DUF3093 domain-containing protein [Nocardioides jensenii]